VRGSWDQWHITVRRRRLRRILVAVRKDGTGQPLTAAGPDEMHWKLTRVYVLERAAAAHAVHAVLAAAGRRP
jgi:hypothetical protein